MRAEVPSAESPTAAPPARRRQMSLATRAMRWVTTGLLSLVFLSAALDKIAHYTQFVAALNSYVVVPGHDGRYIAASVVLAELAVGAGLLVAAARRAAAALMCLMLVVFAAALAVNVYFGVTAGCGCWFTVTLGRPTYGHVLLDLALAGLAASLVFGTGATAPADEP